jgi:DNA repair protein RadC
MSILDWNKEQRPRERLLCNGADVLSDAELLAIFLRTGVKGITAVDLAQQLLTKFGGLSQILSANQATFCEALGLGPSKFATLAAVLEMAKRSSLQELKQTSALNSPQAVQDFLRYWLRGKHYEVFVLLMLDNQNHLIRALELFRGTVNQTAVYPREVVKTCLDHNACSVIFAHNHPSGCAEPSRADQILTQTLKTSLSLVDIQVLDHLIIAGPANFSFAQHGQL